jgi:hypothetical protein
MHTTSVSSSPQPADTRPARSRFATITGYFAARGALTAGLLFALLTLAFFHPVLLEDKTFSVIAGHQSIQWPWAAAPTGFADAAQSDQANYVYPIQVDLNRSLRQGTFPFWTAYSFGGGPTLGTFYGVGLYPPRVLGTLLLPPIWIHDLFILFHVWLAGMATFLLLRRLGRSWIAGMLGGIAWMFCPAWFGLAMLEGITVQAALLPAALWLMHRAVTRHNYRDAVATGAALALFTLGASAQPAVFCFAIVCLWGLLLGTAPERPRSWRGALRRNAPIAITAGALGVALCAFILLPAAAQIADSGRAEIPYDRLVSDDVGLDDFANMIDDHVEQPVTGASVWALTFVGWPVALFALFGFFTRRAGSGIGRWLVVVFFLLIVGTPLTHAAYELVPGFAYLSPLGRLLPFFSFGVVLLAAVGLDAARAWLARLARARRGTAFATVVAGVAVLLVAVEAWQIARYSRDANPPFQPREAAYLYPRTGLENALQAAASRYRQDGNVQRIVPVRRGGPTDPFSPPPFVGLTNLLSRTESIGGYMNVIPERSRILSLMLGGKRATEAEAPLVGAYVAFQYAATMRYDLLERMGVNQIVLPPTGLQDPAAATAVQALDGRPSYEAADGTIVDLPNAAPRAFVVDGVEVAQTQRDALDRFTRPDFPFRTTVLLDADAGVRARTATSSASDAQVRVLPSGPDTRRVEVDSPRAGWLVVLDSWATGWHARVNGEERPVERADFAYRAVQVPAGRSEVRMHYTTPGLRAGITISALGALVALALLLVPLARRRRARVRMTAK